MKTKKLETVEKIIHVWSSWCIIVMLSDCTNQLYAVVFGLALLVVLKHLVLGYIELKYTYYGVLLGIATISLYFYLKSKGVITK